MNIPEINNDFNEINNLLMKSHIPNILSAAVELGIFEIISGQPMKATEVAERAETLPNVTESLLNVLSELGYVISQNDHYFITEIAEEYFLVDSETCQNLTIDSFKTKDGPFSNLVSLMKTRAQPFNTKMWADKKSAIRMEQGAKNGMLQNLIAFVKELSNFNTSRKMCDFAGNVGYCSYLLMELNDNLESHIYDLPEVCDIARELKNNEKTFKRAFYHPFDVKKDKDFGQNYDLFFISHFLYEYADKKSGLTDFFKRVNRSMKKKGLLISNHMAGKDEFTTPDERLSLAIVELMTRSMGYPTHAITEDFLKTCLSEAGFGNFTKGKPVTKGMYPTLLLSAEKIIDVM